MFDENTVLTRPDDAGRARRSRAWSRRACTAPSGSPSPCCCGVAGRPAEAASTASLMTTLTALRHTRAAAHLPAGHDIAIPWDYASAVLTVHASGGALRATDGRDLARSRLVVQPAGWSPLAHPGRPSSPLPHPPGRPRECQDAASVALFRRVVLPMEVIRPGLGYLVGVRGRCRRGDQPRSGTLRRELGRSNGRRDRRRLARRRRHPARGSHRPDPRRDARDRLMCRKPVICVKAAGSPGTARPSRVCAPRRSGPVTGVRVR
ncbi:hypothetical protein SUDANB181_00673 [Streptomyces sp. enrichment culture]